MKIHICILAVLVLGMGACEGVTQWDPVDRDTNSSLESSVFDATDIVEGHDLGRPAGRPVWVGDDVRVSASYQGTLKPGDVCIVSGLWSNPKEGAGTDHPTPLGAGDDLVLFLKEDDNPANRPYENVLESIDLRWIDRGEAITFYQQFPDVIGPQGPDRHNSEPIEDFRQTLGHRISGVAAIRSRLIGPPDARDVPWLLQQIAARQPARPNVLYERNDVYWALIRRLTEFRDPQIMYQAVGTMPNRPLAGGFATPGGREFLLAKLQSPDTPESTRVKLITMIGYAGINHGWTADLSRSENEASGEADHFESGNAAYATRVVRAALVHADDKDFWDAFAEMLPEWMVPPKIFDNAEYRKDVSDAVALLAAYHKHRASDKQQFEIESAFVDLGREYFDMLGRKQGPVDAIVEVDDDPGRTHLLPPSVTLACRWFTLPWLSDSPDQPDTVEMIGRAEDTGHESILDYFPVANFPGFAGVSGGFDVPPVSLPKSLPIGRYHVFLRFLQAGKILGNGHGFEMDQDGAPAVTSARP